MSSVHEPHHSAFFTVQNPERFTPDWKGFYEGSLANRIPVQEKYPHELGLKYGPNSSQIANVYMPAPVPGMSRPVILYLHGGRWREGHPDYYDHMALPWLEAGAVFITAGYRKDPEVTMAEIVQDAAAVLAWVGTNAPRFGGDPERISIGGHSAGGHLAAMAALSDAGRDTSAPPVNVAGLLFMSGAANVAGFGYPDKFNPALHIKRLPRRILVSYGIPEANMVGADDYIFEREGQILTAGLLAHGAEPLIVELPNTNHLQTATAFADPASRLFQAAREIVFG
jgi:arylformamidase